MAIGDLSQYPEEMTEAQLAALLGFTENHARRRRTGEEYRERTWPQHYRDPGGRGKVRYDRGDVREWLDGFPDCEPTTGE